MLLLSKETLSTARVGKLKVIRVMLEHLLPELARTDKTSAHILEMLVLALKERIDEVEQTKH
jgi:hypothetical protein